VVIRDGVITSVGREAVPEGLPVLDGQGGFLTAGLWNCHVHFIDPELLGEPGEGLRDMLLRRGVTSVLDTGSQPTDVQGIRAGIERGDYPGTTIYSAGGSFVYTDGTPVYLPGIQLPELHQPADAAPAVNAVLDGGAQGIKIFAGSVMWPEEPILLPPAIIRAVTDAAHARGGFVVAHPTSRAGLVNAVRNGVDVLAHTAPEAGPLGDALVQEMLDAGVGLIPTLKLWAYEMDRAGAPAAARDAFQQAGVAQLAEFAAAGGEILFGTDVGYMSDFDTSSELALMHAAGMAFPALLAALTTAPATRFASRAGTVSTGEPGDVAIFARDPAADVTALAEATFTVRGGTIVYQAQPETAAAPSPGDAADASL
jgi:imidazolonepropionase-like amidohydrolase